GVDDERDRGVTPGVGAETEFLGGVLLQPRDLPGEPHHHFAGRGRADGPGPSQQYLTDVLFERLDALAHRGRCDAKNSRRTLESALVQYRCKSAKLSEVEIH